MKTTVERVDDVTVKLSITVEAARVSEAVEHAFAHLAADVKVPGFRPGRVPRKVLERRVGRDTIVSEAVREFLPVFYSEAVEAEGLDVVASPELDVERFADGEDAAFTATVEVRPELQLPDLAALSVAHPEWEVTDTEVDAQVEGLRERFAELETVERGAEVGDFVVVTVSGTRQVGSGRVAVEEVAESDVLHEVAADSDAVLDAQLVGARAGAVLRFTDTLGEDYGPELGGQEVAFTALVKEVKVRRLPELDDDFAITASEFDTLAELRQDLSTNLGRQKRALARQALRGEVVKAVADGVEVPLPPSMVAEEERFRLARVAQQAETYGMSLEAYLGAVGSSAEEFVPRAREEAAQTVKAQLVIDAIGRSRGIDVQQEDLAEEIARQALRLGRDPEELARVMTASRERVAALVSDAFRRKTIDAILDEVAVTGAPPEDDDAAELAGGDPDAIEGHDGSVALDSAEAERRAQAQAQEDDAEA